MAGVAGALLGAAALFAAAGCGREKPAQPGPAPAPATTAEAPETPPVPVERTVVVDDEVRRHWKAVEFVVRQKTGGTETVVQVPVGGEMSAAGTPITVRVLSFVPDFAMGADNVTTKSMKDANPAAKVEVLDGGRPLFKGWAFRDFPDMHSFEDPRYTIKMTRAVAAGG